SADRHEPPRGSQRIPAHRPRLRRVPRDPLPPNAMEEPYDPQYPKGDKFLERFGPRNIIRSVATDIDDPSEDPRWDRVGKQKITDAGPLPPHPGMDPA